MERSRRRPAPLLFILLTTFAGSMGLGLALPVLPLLLQSLTGLGPSAVSRYYGLLVMSYSAGRFVCAPVMGKLSDRFGRRPVILIATAAAAVSYVIAATTDSIALLFVARATAGVCAASVSVAMAYVADVTPAQERVHNFGLVGAAVGSGMIAGPLFGGALSSVTPRLAFWAAAALAAATFVFGLLVLPESLPRALRRPLTATRISPFAFVGLIRRSPLDIRLVAGVVLSLVAITAAQSVTMLFLQLRLGWSVGHIGVYLTVLSAVAVVGQVAMMGALIPRVGERRTLRLALLLRSIGWLLTGFVALSWHLYALMVFSLVGSVVQPMLQGIISRTIPDREQGELQGALGSLGYAAEMLGPVAGTAVFGYFTAPTAPIALPGAPFILSALLSLAALVCATPRLTLQPHETVPSLRAAGTTQTAEARPS